MSLKSEMSLNDYVNVVKRKLTLAVVFFLIVFMIAVAYALYLPPIYESSGTVLIESSQLDLDDKANVAFTDDRFAALQQSIMTNDRLIEMAKKYQLFNLNEQSELTGDAANVLSGIMRKSITIEKLQAAGTGWGKKTTFAFEVTSHFNNAEKTYEVTNEIINLFLEENSQNSKKKASSSAEFFEKAAKLKKTELEAIEKQIDSYKRSHAGSLPDSIQFNVSNLDRLEVGLRETERNKNDLEIELNDLQDELQDARNAPPDIDVPVLGSNGELDRLNLELTKLNAIYNDSHPAIKALKRKIQSLEKSQALLTSPVESDISSAQNLKIAKIERRIASVKSRIRSYDADIIQINNKISRAQSAVSQASQADGILGTLERKYASAIEEYNRAKSKYDSAKLDQSAQLENKGERFELLNSPTIPSNPIKPNRVFLIVLGFCAALAGAVGLPIAIESVDGRVRGVDRIASIIKLQPMATIPFIKNDGDQLKVKYEFYNIIYIVFSLVVLSLIVIHFFVTPLDEYVAKL